MFLRISLPTFALLLALNALASKADSSPRYQVRLWNLTSGNADPALAVTYIETEKGYVLESNLTGIGQASIQPAAKPGEEEVVALLPGASATDMPGVATIQWNSDANVLQFLSGAVNAKYVLKSAVHMKTDDSPILPDSEAMLTYPNETTDCVNTRINVGTNSWLVNFRKIGDATQHCDADISFYLQHHVSNTDADKVYDRIYGPARPLASRVAIPVRPSPMESADGQPHCSLSVEQEEAALKSALWGYAQSRGVSDDAFEACYKNFETYEIPHTFVSLRKGQGAFLKPELWPKPGDHLTPEMLSRPVEVSCDMSQVEVYQTDSPNFFDNVAKSVAGEDITGLISTQDNAGLTNAVDAFDKGTKYNQAHEIHVSADDYQAACGSPTKQVELAAKSLASMSVASVAGEVAPILAAGVIGGAMGELPEEAAAGAVEEDVVEETLTKEVAPIAFRMLEEDVGRMGARSYVAAASTAAAGLTAGYLIYELKGPNVIPPATKKVDVVYIAPPAPIIGKPQVAGGAPKLVEQPKVKPPTPQPQPVPQPQAAPAPAPVVASSGNSNGSAASNGTGAGTATSGAGSGAVNVGGNIAPPVPIQPEPDAEMSAQARQDQIAKADVKVSLVVGIDGIPTSAQVVRGYGHGLDEKALECAKKWRFKPAYDRTTGKPVSANWTITVFFRGY